jgi:hypothetical protein
MLSILQKKGKTGWAETSHGMSILAALTWLVTSVLFAQFTNAPAVLAGQPNPKRTGNATELLIVLPEGIRAQTAPELFSPGDLYKKLDGQAELYLSAGFQRLKSQSFEDANNADLWVDLYVYDMGNILNAFAVFSMQRRDEGESTKLGQFSYRTGGSLFFVHGHYYVEIIPSTATKEASEITHALAERFIRENQVDVKPIAELSQFPRSNLIKDSIQLIPSNAFGYEGLNRVFTAHYILGGKKVMAFISRRGSSLEAEELASKYHAFLVRYGGKDAKSGIGIKNSKVVRIAEAYEVIFTHGSYLAGVHEATDKAQAESLAEMVHKRLGVKIGKH